MEDIRLPHSGRGKGTVPVSHAPDGAATIVEIKGGLLSSFHVYGLIDTPGRLERGRMLLSPTHAFGVHRVRAVVPGEYTHLKVERGSTGSAFPSWKIGFRDSGSLPGLVTGAEGGHPDVLRYTGERTTLTLEVDKGVAVLTHRSPGGGEGTVLRRCDGPFRGAVEVPGPGLLEVNCLARWSVALG